MAFVSSGAAINVGLQSADDAAPAATWLIYAARAQNTNPFMQIHINGSLVATAPTLNGSRSSLSPTMSLKLGRAQSTDPFGGGMADVMIYAGRHDDTQRASVEAWITAATPGGFPQ